MILAAANEFGLDLETSILIGDKESDIHAGLAAGVGRNVLYCPTIDDETVRNNRHVIKNLAAAKEFFD